MSFLFFEFIIINLTFNWLDHKWFFWACSILQRVSIIVDINFSFSYFVFGYCILHLNESSCWWALSLVIIVHTSSIKVLFLKSLKKILGRRFCSSNLFHFLPYVLNREVQVIFSGFQIEVNIDLMLSFYWSYFNFIVILNDFLLLFWLLFRSMFYCLVFLSLFLHSWLRNALSNRLSELG